MTVSVVQSAVGGNATTGTTTTATFGATPTPGNTLVAVIVLFAAVIDKNTTTPAGWTGRRDEWSDPVALASFSKVAGGAESTTVTLTHDVVSESVLHIFELDGAWGGDAYAASGGSSFAVPSLSPAAGLDVLFLAVHSIRSPHNVSSGPAGYTFIADNNGGPRMTSWYRQVDPTTGGAQTGTVTYVGSGALRAVQMYFTGVPPAPTADFIADTATGVVPTTVCFTDTSTGTPTSWAWTFGDGGTSTSQNPCHNYTVAGGYTVSLTATNAFGSDTETKSAYINITDDVPYEEPLPGRALVEIYAAEAGAARWDVAKWDEAVWSASTWQDVTPESVNARILWGSNRPELGILSKPDAGSWAIAIYDPLRMLDPANAESPYVGDLLPGLPIRITHRGIVIRQGIAEAITHEYADDSGIIRVQDNIAPLANASVPSDVALSDTLFARAVDAIAAAGLVVTVLPPPPSGDTALAPWVTGVNEWSAWQWITDAAEQSLHIAYVDRIGRLGFRPWATPLARARQVSAEELIGLTSIVQYNGQFSSVSALDDATDTVITRALTPPPRYGVRTFNRTDPTLDAGDWADAVLADRSFAALRWVPGTMYPLTAQSVEDLATIEAVELVGLVHSFTDPEVIANLIIVGGEIEITAKKDDEAKWWFTFEAAQTPITPLITEDDDGFVVSEVNGIDYVYPE